MRYVMRLVGGIIASTMISSSGAIAQETVLLSLDQAAALFRIHNLERVLLLHETERLKGAAAAFSAFPNPTLNLYREDLGHGGPSYSETIVSFRQPLDIYGQPSLRSRVASVEADAADRQFRHEDLALLNGMKSRYMSLVFLQHKHAMQKETLQAFQRAYAAAQARQTEGEISGFDLQRFALELATYKREVTRTTIAFESGLASLLSALGGLQAIGLNAPSAIMESVRLSDSLTFRPLVITQEDAERLAFERRQDLQAAERLVGATVRRLTIARRSRLPQVTLEVGYKRQIDGAQGYVAGGSVSLPFFNQSRGTIREAHARHLQQETMVTRLRQQIRQEVRAAYHAAAMLAEQWQTLRALPLSPAMRDVAWLSYSEGHLSLLEWLDAVRASTEASLLEASILAEYHQALIDLDTAMGGALFEEDDKE